MQKKNTFSLLIGTLALLFIVGCTQDASETGTIGSRATTAPSEDTSLPAAQQTPIDDTDDSNDAAIADAGMASESASSEEQTASMVRFINPRDGDEGIDVDDEIIVTFSDAMDDMSLDEFSFIIQEDGMSSVVRGDIEADSSNTVFTFIPEEPLKPNTQYHVRIISDVKDQQGNELGEEFESSFTTEDVRSDGDA